MDAETKLDSLIKSDPGCQDLKLEYSGLDSQQFEQLMPKFAKLKSIRSLNLSRNRLNSLPKDLSRVFPNLASLDISSNFFSDATKAIDGLVSLPALVDLSADITPNDEKIIFERLRQLQRLNGVDITAIGEDEEIPSRPPGRQEVSMTQKDLRKVAVLYRSIRELRSNSSAELPSDLTEKFDRHISATMEELSANLDAVQDPRMKDPFLRQGEMLLAKHKLYGICFEELCNLADSHDESFGAVLRDMRQVHAGLFSEYPGVLHEMRPHYVRRLADMQDEVVRAERETAQLLQAAEMLEKEAEAHSEQKELMAEKFERERNKLLQENRRLREANSLLKLGGGGGSSSSGVAPASGSKRGASKSKRRAESTGKISVRDLSLKQLKDHISAIFASKLAFDKKCKDAHLPRETIEQHMYTYLNQKYGLRSLIVEHATAIVKAMHKYSEKDNDVAVFRMVYDNVIDEEFRFVQQRLKETVGELLRVYLKGKYPRKTDDAINEILDKRTARANGYVFEEEWVDIVKYMYNREDSVKIIVLIKQLIRKLPQQEEPLPGRGHPRRKGDRKKQAGASGKVKFASFLKVLLDFQLKGHQIFLSRFHAIFGEYDTDKNGVLDEMQMRELVRAVDQSKTDGQIDSIITEVDPYTNQNITYSECVNVLSNELVSLMSQSC